MANNLLSQLAAARVARDRAGMTHETFTPPENPIGNAITQWGRGVAERSTPSGYLNAMANEAQRYQTMPTDELAGSFLPAGLGMIRSGENIPKLIQDMADARRLYEAQRLARLNPPESNLMRNALSTAGAGYGGYEAGKYLMDNQ